MVKLFIFMLGVSSIFGTCQTTKVAIVPLDASKSKNYNIISWRQVSGSPSKIEDSSKVITKIAFNNDGVNYIELTVKDSLGRISKDTLKITVIK